MPFVCSAGEYTRRGKKKKQYFSKHTFFDYFGGTTKKDMTRERERGQGGFELYLLFFGGRLDELRQITSYGGVDPCLGQSWASFV